MSARLFELGRWAFAARRMVVLGWLVVLSILVGGAMVVGVGTNNTYAFPGTESQDALDSLSRTFPQFAGTSAQLVAVAPDGGDVTSSSFSAAVADAVDTIGSVPQVSGVTNPYDGPSTGNVAPDDSAVLVPIQLSVAVADVTPATSEALQQQGRDLQAALPDGSKVAVGGQLYSQVDAGIGISEASGLAIAFVVLAFTFGALAAAGMPLATAVVGVGVSVGIVFMATRFVTITSTGPLLAVMLGLAVGVDYAVFIVSRHQEQLRQGMSPETSAPRAVATAGSAVVFAATTVVIALLGLSVARIPFLTVTGVAAAITVAFAALVALTLTPALLGFAQWRVVGRRHRPTEAAGERGGATDVPVDSGSGPVPAGHADDGESSGPATASGAAQGRGGQDAPGPDPDPPGGFFGRWVRVVTWVPLLTVVAVTGLLVYAAAPALNLRLALPDAGALPPGEPGRVAYDLVSEHFGPGSNGPLLVTGSVIQSTDPVALVDDLADRIAATPGVDSVPLATPNQTGDTAVIQVIPEGAPDSEATEDLVGALRAQQQELLDDYAVDLSVTGYTALGIDISTRLGGAMLPFGLLVVGLSLVLLMMVFRSVVVPITAALGYLLSIGAAFGLVTRVFIDGDLTEALQVANVGSVISFTPIIVMGVLFGLAMDYEVFLVTRMKGDYDHDGDPHLAIERGFVASAPVVTAAAVIMTAVFGGFVRGGDANIQPIAFGLAVGVAIDAFVVRMVLIPAVLATFGHHAWWLPGWLDRRLPQVDVEGQGLEREDELADWPATSTDTAIALEQVRTERMGRASAGLDGLVPNGDVLVVEGGDHESRTEVLLALTGRLPVTAGRCKVAGLVLPTRAASVRARSAVALLGQADDPPGMIQGAAVDGPAVLGVEGADRLSDAAVRRRVRDMLAEATAGIGTDTSARATLILTSASRDGVADLVPAGARVHAITLAQPAQVLQAVGEG